MALQDLFKEGKELKVFNSSRQRHSEHGDAGSKPSSEPDPYWAHESWEQVQRPATPDMELEGEEPAVDPLLLTHPLMPKWHAVAAFCTRYAAQLLSHPPGAPATAAVASAIAAADDDGQAGLQELVDLWRPGVLPW